MITAIRKKIIVKVSGQIEICSPEFETGTIAEVIVLIEKQPEDNNRAKKVSELKSLFITTQALPNAGIVTEDEILAEIASYRANKE